LLKPVNVDSRHDLQSHTLHGAHPVSFTLCKKGFAGLFQSYLHEPHPCLLMQTGWVDSEWCG
jgi:hypothetical protein